jgi:acyl carrier protein
MSRILDDLKVILSRHSDGVFCAEEIPNDAPVFGTGGIVTESLQILDALCEIEQEFNINIPDEDLTEELFASVSSLAHYVDHNAQTG